MLLSGSSGQKYQLDTTPFKSGGEGKIYHLAGNDKKLAKIYLPGIANVEPEKKLDFIVKNPPNANVLNQVAWPLDVLYDSNQQFCGFIMPELNINATLGDIYHYCPIASFSIRQKIRICQNICAVITAVHAAGYVIGDFNPQNIGVDKKTGTVAFLDVDSYHVTDNFNKVYRCNVCADGYAAPELLEACAAHAAAHPNDKSRLYEKTPFTFSKKTDDFALAIHLFKLLMNGFSPFSGIIETVSPSQSSPSRGNAAIRRNEYCFRPGYKPLSVAVPPLNTLPQDIADLFTRAFLVNGIVDPNRRPTSVEWHKALTRCESTLVDCSRNSWHQYDGRNATCPFCEADNRYSATVLGGKPVPYPKQAQQWTPPPSQQRAFTTTTNSPWQNQLVPASPSNLPIPRYAGNNAATAPTAATNNAYPKYPVWQPRPSPVLVSQTHDDWRIWLAVAAAVLLLLIVGFNALRNTAQEQQAARQETARQQQAARQEAARQEAARQEAARQEAARQEAAKQEAARQEAAKQEAARREAMARTQSQPQPRAKINSQPELRPRAKLQSQPQPRTSSWSR